jgi:hypothetical protein
MKRTSTATLKPTPQQTLLFVAGAAALILAVALARHCSPVSVPPVDPVISIERTQTDDTSTAQTTNATPKLPDDGEVYRTADRLREASALALAAALYAANEEASRHLIHSADGLIAGVRSAGLFPPGVTEEGAATLVSDWSRLSLRFRSAPLTIEVLSFPRCQEDGPALMIRIPSLDADGTRGSIFIADRLGDINAPAPFASLPHWVRAGWVDQSLDQAEIPEAQQQQLRAWLTTKSSKQ